MKGNDAFERSLRASLEGYEVPYNSADWSQLEQAMDDQRTSSWWASPVLYLAMLAGAVAVSSTIYLVSLNKSGNGEQEKGTTSTTQGAVNQTDDAQAMQDAPAQPSSGVPAVNDPVAGVTASIGVSDVEQSGSTRSSGNNVPTNSTQRSIEAKKGTDGSASGTVAAVDLNGRNNDPKGAFTASLSHGCSGASVEFNVNNMPEDGIYLWNFGDGSFSNKPNPSHTYNKPGRFTVTLSLSRSGAGTITNEPYADMIVIDEVPVAEFDHIYREYTGHVPSVHFENRSHGGANYHWDFGDGTESDVAHPDHVYRSKGDYKVVLTVRNSAGCEDVVEKQVRIDNDYNLLAPVSFSPNGDGNDDLFMPQALKDLGVKFQLSIYEPSSGRLVYQTSDATKPWTGRMMNSGAMCAPGEYVWMVEVKEGLHLGDITYEGKVTLVN